VWRHTHVDTVIDLAGADLRAANLSGVNFIGVDLSKADLTLAHLIGADLTGACLKETCLVLANLDKTNLRRANLVKANLMSAYLGQVKLDGASLMEACLDRATLYGAQLNEANFNQATLRNTDLSETALSGAVFIEADLTETNLSNAFLAGCNFAQATMDGTILGSLDLTSATGLEEVEHSGPSRISIDTIALSKGNLPRVFLQGCGLSDWEIEEVKLYNPDLSNDEVNQILYNMYGLRATQALQISPVFVSYSHADHKFVDRIGESFTEKGIRYWRDTHQMKAGRLEKQIDRAIRQNPTVLLVLSEHSLTSDWVQHEVRKARELEKEMGRDVLCPVALDNSWKSRCWPERIMEQVTEYNILDFSKWEDDAKFGDMFHRLIDGLQLFYKG
jgi:uncharacterized protein YjbI with pentapeptide repeats